MEALSLFELKILNAISALSNPAFDALARVLNVVAAHGEIFILLSLLLLIKKATRPVGVICLTALLFDYLALNVVIKPLVARIRPYDLNPAARLIVEALKDFSFPSGHTGAAFAFAAAVSPLGKRAHMLSLAFAALMGLSRLYLYVHYPTDVLAGAVVGTLCGMAALFLWKKLLKCDII